MPTGLCVLVGFLMVVAARPVSASIIYTSSGRTISPGPSGGGGGVRITFDSDPSNDPVVGGSGGSSTSSILLYGGAVPFGAEADATGNVADLPADSIIGPTSTFSTPQTIFMQNSDGTTSGNFTPGIDAFIGVKITFPGNSLPNYGYVEYETLSSSDSPSVVGKVIDFAYESTPGVAISAGAGAVPEPAGVAFFCAAGLALLARRQRAR